MDRREASRPLVPSQGPRPKQYPNGYLPAKRASICSSRKIPASCRQYGSHGATTDEWVVMGKLANANEVSLPNALDFGNVKKATTKSLTMVNLGTAARNVGAITLAGDKTITKLASSTCKATTVLNVGQRCKVDLRYKPGTTKMVGGDAHDQRRRGGAKGQGHRAQCLGDQGAGLGAVQGGALGRQRQDPPGRGDQHRAAAAEDPRGQPRRS